MDALAKVRDKAWATVNYLDDFTESNQTDFTGEVVDRDPTEAILALNQLSVTVAFLARDLLKAWKERQEKKDSLLIDLPGEIGESLERAAEMNGETVNDLFNRAIREYVEAHGVAVRS